ncbi:hypothetical protein JCM5353_000634 [Sporobolomyces roseus]
MNSPQSLKSVDEASRHAEGRPTASSTLPPTRSSLPPASLASLPPELLRHIFESTLWIDCTPSTSRAKFRKTLASLCRINKFLLSIARPLLYRNVSLRFGVEEYNDSGTSLRQLCNTLLQAEHCARLVKEVQIDLSDCSSLEMAAVGYILSSIGPLDRIRLTSVLRGIGREFARILLKHQPNIKHLELPNLYPTGNNLKGFVGGMKKLETLIVDIDYELELPYPLVRFVCTTALTPALYSQIRESSWTSLTSLAFFVEPGRAQFDLGRFCNLRLLRISVDDNEGSHLWPHDEQDIDLPLEERKVLQSVFVKELQLTVRSAQSLPISTLSLVAQLGHVCDLLAHHCLFDLLPPSLRHLTSTYGLLVPRGINYSLFSEAFLDGRFPLFQRITIYPSQYIGGKYVERKELRATSLRFKADQESMGISVDLCNQFERGASAWYDLEPYYVDSGEEEESSGSESSESNDGSDGSDDSDDSDDSDGGPEEEEWSSDNEHL